MYGQDNVIDEVVWVVGDEAILKSEVEEARMLSLIHIYYQEKVDKSLKSFRQKAQIPGFRKGMVPMSLVKKMYGKSADVYKRQVLLRCLFASGTLKIS